MRKLTVAYLFGLTALVANAQTVTVEKPVICSNLKTIIENLSKDYQEEPAWSGKDNTSRYIMMSNKKTGTWTIIQFNDRIACILGTGNSGMIVNLDKYTL